MKKITALLLTIVMLLALIGCNSSQPALSESTPEVSMENTQAPQTETTEETTAPVSTMRQKPMAAVAVPMNTQTYRIDDGTDLFTYTYQSMTLVLQDPEVADKVIVDFLNRVDSVTATAEQLHTSAESAYITSSSWVPYMCQLLYEPMRIDQGVLSLFGTLSTYSGGIHPDHINVSANYDLITGDVLTLGSIMHKDATMQMFCDLVIQELNNQKDELYLYDDFELAVEKRFSVDESQDEAFYFSSSGLCFYFSPYEIAPYSSGTIIAEIPYEKLVGLLYDAYFPAERVLTDGTISAVPFQEADMDSIYQIGEAVLTPGSEMYLLTASKSLENIRIHFDGGDRQVHGYVFFAASALNPGDGIMIEATEDELANIHVTYDNCDGSQIFSPVL